MQKFLDHRVQVIRRRTEYLLREAKRRGHVLEGQLIAIARHRGGHPASAARRRTAPRRRSGCRAWRCAASLMERAIGAEAFAALQRELGAHRRVPA